MLLFKMIKSLGKMKRDETSTQENEISKKLNLKY